MKILILGYSKIFRSRILPAIEKIESITGIDVASYSGKIDIRSTKLQNFYNDYEEALSDSQAAIVYISVINSMHYYWAKKFIGKGYHVIVDKPAVLYKNEAQELVELARKYNRCIAEALVYQYHPQVLLISEIFKKHKIVPTKIITAFSFPGFSEDNFRYQTKLGGGAIYDLGPYALSIGRLLFEENSEELIAYNTSIEKETKDQEIETSFSLIARFSGGRILLGQFGFDTEYINHLTILGERLSIKVERIYTIPSDVTNKLTVRHNNNEETIQINAADNFQLFLQSVIASINTGDYSYFENQFLTNAVLLETLKKNIK